MCENLRLNCRSFNVYGYRFRVRSAAEEPLAGIQEDFAFFSTEASADGVLIELFPEDPPLGDLPAGAACVYTPRNVVYREAGRRFIDYHGRALGIQDEASGHLRLYSRDLGLLYEAAYLYLLSQIGQRLDQTGLHRIHALGLSVGQRAILVLLPMGGGKSTLGLHALAHPDVQILSDDSPFVDRHGRLLAFPLRLGLLPGSEDSIPAEYRRKVQRMEFGPKHLVNFSYFRDRVCASAKPGLLLIGSRSMSAECRIEKLSRLAAMRSCMVNCVVGVGLFQGLEFLLNASVWELFRNCGLGISRFRNCWQLLSRSEVCRISLGRNPELNARTLVEFARNCFETSSLPTSTLPAAGNPKTATIAN
jgi:hypothetical protein